MIVADGSKSWVGLPRGYVYGWLGNVIMVHFGGEGMREQISERGQILLNLSQVWG